MREIITQYDVREKIMLSEVRILSSPSGMKSIYETVDPREETVEWWSLWNEISWYFWVTRKNAIIFAKWKCTLNDLVCLIYFAFDESFNLPLVPPSSARVPLSFPPSPSSRDDADPRSSKKEAENSCPGKSRFCTAWSPPEQYLLARLTHEGRGRSKLTVSIYIFLTNFRMRSQIAQGF